MILDYQSDALFRVCTPFEWRYNMYNAFWKAYEWLLKRRLYAFFAL